MLCCFILLSLLLLSLYFFSLTLPLRKFTTQGRRKRDSRNLWRPGAHFYIRANLLRQILRIFRFFGLSEFAGNSDGVLSQKAHFFIRHCQPSWWLRLHFRSLVPVLDFPETLPPLDGSPISDKQLMERIELVSHTQFRGGNKVTCLSKNTHAYSFRLEALKKAKESIHIFTWLFYPDQMGATVFDILKERTEEGGVKASVIMDNDNLDEWLYSCLGSFGEDSVSVMLTKLQSSLVEPVFWKSAKSYYDLKNHRKMTVVDGKVAIVGGRNIGDPYHQDEEVKGNYVDMDIAIEGPSARQALYMCERRVKEQLEDLPEATIRMDEIPEEYFEGSEECGNAFVAMIDHSSNDSGYDPILLATIDLIRSSTISIDMGHCYFVGWQDVYDELAKASQRGVKIRCVVNSHEVNDLPVYSKAMVGSVEHLLKAGVEVWVKNDPNLYHCKYMVFDNRVVNVGSWNFWALSAFYECEANSVVVDKTYAQEMTAEFERHMKMSRRVDTHKGLTIPTYYLDRVVLCLFAPWSLWDLAL